MRTRSQLAVAQLAVFVGGSILAPVAHLARHRPDHSHGPAGQAIALKIQAHDRASHPNATPPAHDHRLVPDHPHGQGHPDGHLRPHGHGKSAPRPRPTAAAEPLDATHGHGNIAHFGLALLSAPPPLALPAPESAGVLPRAAHPRAAALFEPSFPFPRPPPAAALS